MKRKPFNQKHLITVLMFGTILFVVVSLAYVWKINAVETVQPVSADEPFVKLYDTRGKEVGTAILTQEPEGVRLQLKVSGLAPGKHGFHIHEKAFVRFDFKTTGGHFNPDGKKHGHSNPDGHHLGDMPNLEVKSDGTAEADFLLKAATLEKSGAYSLRGKSIIIHADEDDYKTDPAGNAGDRVVGGNIPE